MYYLKDSNGNTVRAIQWNEKELIFIRRHDSNRIETCSDVKFYDLQKIKYDRLDSVQKDYFINEKAFKVKHLNNCLTLVVDSEKILKNIELNQDDNENFNIFLGKTSLFATLTASIVIAFTLLKSKPTPRKEIQIVQVMDRQQIESSFISVAAAKKISTNKRDHIAKPKRTHTVLTKKASRSVGVLSFLGELNKSNQKNGLKLNQISTSAGVGTGGLKGSGGVQTSVYSKGLFSAPIGPGFKINGNGGYGTKGKGGGQPGYGQIQLVGQGGQNYFQPIESEAFVEGGLDRSEIAAVIQRHLSEIRYCYEQGLQKKPGLAGRVAIRFFIGSNGLVTLAQVDQSSLRHPPVETCIRDRLKTWNFPHPEGGVTVKVTYPFILRRMSDT